MATNNALNESATGIVVLSSAGATSGVTVTGTSNQISISNGDGTAGNPTASLTSTIQVSGISFDSGTTTLSTYTTGTFTPIINNATTPPTLTYTAQIGRYTQIGNRVFLNIHIILATYAAGTGSVLIQQLPFTTESTTNNTSVAPIGLINVTFGASVLWYTAVVSPAVTQSQILGMRSANTALPLGQAAPGGTAEFLTTIIHEV